MEYIKSTDSLNQGRIKLNNWKDIITEISSKISQLVIEDKLTPEQYAEFIAVLNNFIKKGEVTVADINLNLGKIGLAHLSDEVIKAIAGTAAVNAVPADGSITYTKLDANVYKKIAELSSVVFKDNIKNPYYLKAKALNPANSKKIAIEFIFDSNGLNLTNSATYKVDLKYYTSSSNATGLSLGLYQNNSSTPNDYAGGTAQSTNVTSSMTKNAEKTVSVSYFVNNNSYRYKHLYVEVDSADGNIFTDFHLGDVALSVNGVDIPNIISIKEHRVASDFTLERRWYDLSADVSNLDTIAKDIEELQNAIIAKNQTRFNGLKVNIIGDSITDPARAYIKYHDYLKTDLQLSVVRPYGVSSSTISSPSNAQAYQPMCDRYMNMDDDADLVILFGGTNDYGYSNATFGTMFNPDGTPNKDKTSFYGGLHVLLEGLIKKYTNRGSDILIMTPIPRQAITTPNSTTGKYLKDYVNAIKEVAAYYSLPILDLYNESGLQANIPEVLTKYVPDGTHPNSEGHRVIANRLIGKIKTL